MACGILDMRTAERVWCAVYWSSALDTCRCVYCLLLTDWYDDDDVTARWSPDRKWKTVSVDPSGTVATTTGGDYTYGYIQTTEAVSKGVHTW